MVIPNTARKTLISGVSGNISHDSPTRVVAVIVNSAIESNNAFGRAFTYANDGTEQVQAGGSGVFAGILIHPKAVLPMLNLKLMRRCFNFKRL